MLVLGGWWVGWRWGGGSQLQDHHHYDGLKKLLKMMYHTGGKKIVSIRWLAGGVGVGWRKPAAGPSPLQQAQKIVKNDVSYMGV